MVSKKLVEKEVENVKHVFQMEEIVVFGNDIEKHDVAIRIHIDF